MSDKPIKVLLIEDNPGDARIMQEFLSEAKSKSFQIEVAERLLDGLEALSARSFDVILLDLSLPDSSGLETLAKAQSNAQQVAIVVLTGLNDEDLAVEAVRKGAQDYLVKGQIDKNLLPRAILYAIERKRMEEALKESEEKYRTILENIEDAYYEVDNAGNFTFFNDSLCKISGYTKDELIGMNNRQYMDQENAKKVYQTFNKVYNTRKPEKGFDYKFIRKDGNKGHANASISLMEDAEGQRIGFRGIIRDITQRKQAEEEKKKLEMQLHRAQRMESLGTLAGGIAHNFNNLLQGIQGNASLVLMDIDSNHPYYDNIKDIDKLIKSGSKLTKQLLGYARKGRYEVKAINLNQLVKETSGTFGITKKEITVHRELAENLFRIEGDWGQIEQILLNLYVNAADAMPGGGDLFLKTMNVTDKDMTSKDYKAKSGNYVLLTVRDRGVGMEKKTMERIFEPFFTTKGLAKGTGLGLASVYGIIKAHGGYIDVDSEKEHGTTFSIYLPASEKVLAEEKEFPDDIVKGKETVLLVDDEETVLDVGVKMLENLGYTVLEAKGGSEAVEVYNENKDEVDMVILDMIMPEVSGGKTYDKIKEINSKVKVLLSSGYSREGQAEEILKRGCDGFIQKPFSVRGLSVKIREVLAA